MDIRKYITKKNVIIGAVAGTAVLGGIVALAIKHHKKKKDEELEEFLYDEDFEDDDDDDFWLDDLDDEWDEEEEEPSVSPQLEERITQYHDAAERLLKELENGTYGK